MERKGNFVGCAPRTEFRLSGARRNTGSPFNRTAWVSLRSTHPTLCLRIRGSQAVLEIPRSLFVPIGDEDVKFSRFFRVARGGKD